MDDAVARLERARAANPDDAQVCVELARAYVRVGRPLRALAVLGPRDAREREVAGQALARALGLDWVGVIDGVDRFLSPGRRGTHTYDQVLVHAGAYLEDGESGLASSLSTRIGRADVKRSVLPAFLAEVGLELAGPLQAAERAATLGGRLPSAAQWKKLWRGGLFLDGDESQRVDNPDPDRLLPGRTPYGAHFAPSGCEVLRGGQHGGVFERETGRYLVAIATDEQRRGRDCVWRFVRDLPAHP